MADTASDAIVVRVGTRAFALPPSAVTDVLEAPRVTALAGLPPRVAGVVRHRGRWLPALWLDEVVAGEGAREHGGSGSAAARTGEAAGGPERRPGGAGVALVLRRGAVAYALLAEARGGEGVASAVDPERLFRAPLPASLAREVVLEGEGAAVMETVSFLVDGVAWGVPMETVQEVLPEAAAPAVEPGELGARVSARGRRVPVLDLRAHFGLPPAAAGAEGRVVVVDTAEGPLGLRVDAMGPVVSARADAIIAPPERVARWAGGFLDAVVRLEEDRLLLLLRPDRLLPSGRLAAAQEGPG